MKIKKICTQFKKGNIPWNKGIKWLEMRGKNNPMWRNKVKTKCANCGKILEKSQYQIRHYQHSFCNRKCTGNYFHNYPAKGVGAKKGERRSIKAEFKKGIRYNPETEFKKGDIYFKERWKDNHYLFNFFHGHLFPNISRSQLTKLDEEVIRAKVRYFKLKKKRYPLPKNKETAI